MEQTWKKQMKFYGVAAVAGLAMLFVALPQLAGTVHQAPDPIWLILVVIGGLGLLGGLFGLAVAFFFHLWHQKGDAKGE